MCNKQVTIPKKTFKRSPKNRFLVQSKEQLKTAGILGCFSIKVCFVIPNVLSIGIQSLASFGEYKRNIIYGVLFQPRGTVELETYYLLTFSNIRDIQ